MSQTAGPPRPTPTGALSGFLRGAGLLARGLGLYARSPRLLILGLIPVVITAIVFTALIIVLLIFLGDLAAAATWFADDWSDTGQTVVQVIAGIAILGLAVLLSIVTFTATALTLGEPLYERISDQVEQWCGGMTGEVEIGFWRGFRQSLADSARVVAITASLGIVLFAAGFLPAVGQTVVPVLGAAVGGWFLALELVGIPYNRRGLRLRDRRQGLRGHRPTALGFGMAVFLCFLIPGGAVLMMPAAVAGGTLLARQTLGLPSTPLTGSQLKATNP